MYATFEEFIEHQQHQPSSHPEHEQQPSVPLFAQSSSPPPPAPSYHTTVQNHRKKMSARTRRRRHDHSGGGGSSGSRDDINSSGGACSDTPLVATIRSIQEGRRSNSTISGGESDEHHPPGPAPGGRNYSSQLISPAPNMAGLQVPSCMDALSCGGYAGTNSIDSGYKSACPTPDLSDSVYHETLFLRSSSSGITSPRARIAMGTRVMSRGARIGSDPSYYEDMEPSTSPNVFHRRPSISPGPRSSSAHGSRPRSASIGSRSSPTAMGTSRRTLRNSPHMSSTGSLTSSGVPYSRHSSPGGAYSSGDTLSPSSRGIDQTDLDFDENSSSSQLALLEREIDALLTATNDESKFQSLERPREVSPSISHSQQSYQGFSAPEDISPSRPPRPPHGLRGNQCRGRSRTREEKPALRHCAYDDRNKSSEEHGCCRQQTCACTHNSIVTHCQANIPHCNHSCMSDIVNKTISTCHCLRNTTSCCSQTNLNLSHLLQASENCDVRTNLLLQKLLESTFKMNSVSRNNWPKNLSGSKCEGRDMSNCSSPHLSVKSSNSSRTASSTNNTITTCIAINDNDNTSVASDLSLSSKCKIGKRPGKLCRRGTPYPHTPETTVEECAARLGIQETPNYLPCNRNLDNVSVNSCDSSKSTNVPSGNSKILRTSRSFEDLSASETSSFSSNLNKQCKHMCGKNPDHLYHYHLYEPILYSNKNEKSDSDVPPPPPLPTRPPHLTKHNQPMTDTVMKRIDTEIQTLEENRPVQASEMCNLPGCIDGSECLIPCTDPNCSEKYKFFVNISKDNKTSALSLSCQNSANLSRNVPPLNKSIEEKPNERVLVASTDGGNSKTIFSPINECPDCQKSANFKQSDNLYKRRMRSPDVSSNKGSSKPRSQSEERVKSDAEILKNIPPKARLTLGIGEEFQYTSKRKHNKLTASIIKKARANGLLYSSTKTVLKDKFTKDKNSEKDKIIPKENIVKDKNENNFLPVLVTDKNDFSTTEIKPPTPPPHAAVLRYDVNATPVKEEVVCKTPVPPPRTTSTLPKKGLRLPNPQISNERKPLPPLPSRTLMSLPEASDLTFQNQKNDLKAFEIKENKIIQDEINLPVDKLIRKFERSSSDALSPSYLPDAFGNGPLATFKAKQIVSGIPEVQVDDLRRVEPKQYENNCQIQSGSFIQPSDDEYGFNVASYLI